MRPESAGKPQPVRYRHRHIAFRRRRQNRIVLAAESALELGPCEQSTDFRIASGGQNGEPVECTSQRRVVDRLFVCVAIPAGDLQRRIAERPREAKAATLPTIMISRYGDGEVHRRYSAEFAVDLAGRLDVVGNGEADDAGGDLARRVDEALVRGARPVNLDQNIGAADGGFAPDQHILARIVGVPPQDRVIEALSREFGHLHIEGRMGRPTLIHSGNGAGRIAARPAGVRKRLAVPMARIARAPI